MYIHFNPNPCGRTVGDCAVRAISAALDMDWEEAFDILTKFARNMCDMPSSDQVWGAVLRANGFYRQTLPSHCPDCYTAKDFCYGNVTSTAIIKVPRGCCFSIAVESVSASNDPTVTSAPVIEVQNANFVIDRIA